jgi:hypothetical protein
MIQIFRLKLRKDNEISNRSFITGNRYFVKNLHFVRKFVIFVQANAKDKKRRARVTRGNQEDCIADIDFHMDL